MRLIFVLCLLPALLPAAPAAAEDEPGLVGAWRLVDWYLTDADGQKTYPFGPSPTGQLLYSADGQMSAQLMRPDIQPPETLAEVIDKQYFAYYGGYTLEPDTATVIHHVEGSLVAPVIGTDLVRQYRFVNTDTVEIFAVMEAEQEAGFVGENVLVWERVQP